MDRRRRPLGSIAVLAWAGVVAGHWIAYVVAVPGADARTATLAETGHGYWLAAVAAAFVLGVASVAGTVARHVGRGIRREPPVSATARYRQLAVSLALLQTAMFVVQEILERVEAGAPLSGLLHGGFVLIGVGAQVVVAALLALALTSIGKVAEVAGRVLAAAPAERHPRGARSAPPVQAVAGRIIAGALGSRAPPSLLVANR
jgi:hypothetical protein